MMKMGTFRTVALTVSIMCGNPMLPGDNNDIGMQCPGGNDLLPLVSDFRRQLTRSLIRRGNDTALSS
jgi:hypothetical protein